jgi:hypothetical protein
VPLEEKLEHADGRPVGVDAGTKLVFEPVPLWCLGKTLPEVLHPPPHRGAVHPEQLLELAVARRLEPLLAKRAHQHHDRTPVDPTAEKQHRRRQGAPPAIVAAQTVAHAQLVGKIVGATDGLAAVAGVIEPAFAPRTALNADLVGQVQINLVKETKKR